MTIIFKKLTEKADLEALEALEATVWSPASVIPLHMTLTLHKFGGLFLGAYEAEEMIGFLYSFPGYMDGEASLCSHMLGFLPAYRKRGLGVAMKWLQREEALKLGHNKITWTFDPLETVNGYLNIAKLGGVVRTYLPNCYGELNDDLNRGLPTDRFLVEWFISSERVEGFSANRQRSNPLVDPASVLDVLTGPDNIPYPGDRRLDAIEQQILVPVPSSFQEVKRASMKTAAAWRNVTRELFTHYFTSGYVVTEVIRDNTKPIVYYLLQKASIDVVLRESN